VGDFRPEIVIHMAAQALVRRSYRQPLETFATNVMGTANLLAAVLAAPAPPQVVLAVTSDKVYGNDDSGRACREDDRLGGDDPYSASKACAELVAHSFRQSFAKAGTRVATARAGNVIGGGDWAEDRLIPDMVRSLERGEPFVLRNPNSTRPWQHVFDVLNGYFAYVEALAAGDAPSSLNFGPRADGGVTTAEIVALFAAALGRDIPTETAGGQEALKEKRRLALDATLAARTLGWRPRLTTAGAVRLTADWYGAYLAGRDMRAYSLAQLRQYGELADE
jgi:CDP-glucose 4,6-dehydratase